MHFLEAIKSSTTFFLFKHITLFFPLLKSVKITEFFKTFIFFKKNVSKSGKEKKNTVTV